jgi:VanZ family protein
MPRVQKLATPTPAGTGTRLGWALFGYMLCVTLIITLVPFRFDWPAGARSLIKGDPLDFAANVLLFVPLGFFYRLARTDARSSVTALALGAAASFAIETIQYFQPARTPSLLDVASNALGAWLGALGAVRMARANPGGGRLVGWLALQLPLMGLVYLLVPLLWIDALSWRGESPRVILAPLLAAFGALLLGGMHREYLGGRGGEGPERAAALAALWFIAGAFPALGTHPTGVIAGLPVAVLVCWWSARRPHPASWDKRRFEVSLLKSAAPLYAAYLALITLLPLRFELAPWSLHVGFTEASVVQREILRLLEVAAACTLAGYMLAEWRGRALPHYRDAAARLAAFGFIAACVLEALWGFRAAHGASIARGALMVAATLYGGWLYYLQRAHVVRLLSEPAARADRSVRPRNAFR